ncbi:MULTISPECIES: ABC transporter substrate-binding protein [unclassified Oceanispirochaeta]|uniref:ABC transporter substrate-binding protein n=1 Tax=unclassified Oceanispirochaeta TaxID=2635722 RepID=UPI000E0974CB|nr:MULTISPECIES: ABC transporter substrate-binding protein [unclassified Oceanispirochaeta]MBF9016525.1 carbohydrate ABC transporter substrate-binding protein [Oceanispirochaeta sp. M2]NPD72987.1 carbohydrate ABC transporter substrate-binding protein [Oceanispirochaeta sp. M1]RDG31331.1 carbohydrate ABC transporter substrate-binding protein [Oceanispirochaeta sp. M1]
MKRVLLGLLMMAVLTSGLFAKGAQEEESGVITLTIMAPWADGELAGFKPVMEAYEAENPGIKLEYVSGKPEDTATVLGSQFSVGKTPADVIDTSFSWYIREQGAAGHLLDFTDDFASDDFMAGAMDMVSVDGRAYGAPSVGGVTIAEYRKSFFKDNGLKDPTTLGSYDDFLDLIKEIQEIEGVEGAIGSGGGVGWTFTSVAETLILTFGGVDMHRGLTAGELSWTDPSVKMIFMDYLLPLIQEGYYGEPDEFDAVIKAMWDGIHGVYIGDSTDNMMLDPALDRGVFLYPGQKGVVLWNDFWFAPKYTEHEVETRKLLKFLATRGQEIQISNGGRMGTYTKIPMESYPQSEREVFEVIKGVAVVPDMDDTIGGKFQATFWGQMGLVWSRPDEATLDSVLETLQSASEETLSK